MINFIGGLLVMLIVAFLFSKIRGFIFKRAKKTVKDITGFGCSIGNSTPINKEKVSSKKFVSGMVSLKDPVGWLKDISSLFNLRKLIIYGIILSCIFAYGWYQGRKNIPIQIGLDYDKEFKMKLDSHYLLKPKYSQDLKIVDENGNLVKSLKVKDFPLLAKKLKPIGFILEPIGVMGLGAGDEYHFEAGAGVSFIKYWKWKLDTFLTNRGIYLGTSYQITDNSGLGLGIGKGYDASNRIMLYYKWRF